MTYKDIFCDAEIRVLVHKDKKERFKIASENLTHETSRGTRKLGMSGLVRKLIDEYLIINKEMIDAIIEKKDLTS
jgi:hypothetical protein